MKYLVLKVAGGVFLGILAAFLVYKAFDLWEAEQRARLYVQEQKQDADALKERVERAAQHLLKLTSNELTKLCGSPLQSTVKSSNDMYFTSMEYLGADSHTITLTFRCSEGKEAWCLFDGMKRDRGAYDLSAEAYESYVGSDGKYHPADKTAEVKELPCLAGR
jgi:hypothetical protein